LHYLLVNATFSADAPSGGREVKVGAYRIIAYQPAIEYASWKWSVSPEAEWWRQTLDDSSWTRVALPVREALDPTLYAPIPSVRWPAKTVMFRGQMVVPSVSHAVWLVLNIRDSPSSRHAVAAFYVNGRPVKAARTVAHDSLESRNVEVLMDVTSNLRTGSNSIAFEVSGLDGEFDLDLYEFQLADPNRRTHHYPFLLEVDVSNRNMRSSNRPPTPGHARPGDAQATARAHRGHVPTSGRPGQ